MPDERFGQRVVALIVSRSGIDGLASELAEFVKGRMAGYKRPRAYLEVAAIPRLPNGKADYKAAKALAEQQALAGAAMVSWQTTTGEPVEPPHGQATAAA
ncbi:MAG: hypothetical protein MZU91_12115 [Desulfosudis oleivorans]|nr:hypothetical protein [Desulfosudis oleivorans]